MIQLQHAQNIDYNLNEFEFKFENLLLTFLRWIQNDFPIIYNISFIIR